MQAKSLLIKLPNWMGDILFSLDLLYTLSASFERIGLCTSTRHEELLRLFPVPRAEVIAYQPEKWPYLDRDTIRKIEDFQADFGLLLPNSIGSALIFRYAGVSRLFGFALEHRQLLLYQSIPAPNHRMHQTEYYLQLLKLFDLSPQSYPVVPSAQKDSLVVIHPGASKMERAWHLDRFLRVAETLREQGLEVAFVSGEPIQVPSFRLLLRPSLSDFANLLSRSSLFIGNDSGPLHLAQQCGVPVVGIYGPGNPLTTGPRPITPSRVIYHSFPCSPCRQRFFKECDPARSRKPYCIETIRAEEVTCAAEEMLKNGI